MDASLNIVDLIENNPIIKLSPEYNNRFINKIKEIFTETQQQLFVSSFYCYLNYNQTTDFVIDLDNIWKWLEFSTKQKSKLCFSSFVWHSFLDISQSSLLKVGKKASPSIFTSISVR